VKLKVSLFVLGLVGLGVVVEHCAVASPPRSRRARETHRVCAERAPSKVPNVR
jgi:hypothetical protein